MLPPGVMRPGIAPGWPGNKTAENVPWLYRKPFMQAADPVAGQYEGESTGAEVLTGAVYCPTISPEGLIPLATVGRVPATPARAPGTSIVVNCPSLNRNPCSLPTASV